MNWAENKNLNIVFVCSEREWVINIEKGKLLKVLDRKFTSS